LRKRFNLEEGDYLEAEAVEDGIILEPISVMDREHARRQRSSIVRYIPPSCLRKMGKAE
jgi:bifunctional DNA-binding transcriptional regulator/antitoxin component of YhaV-PrlF toxin-antitoxin module